MLSFLNNITMETRSANIGNIELNKTAIHRLAIAINNSRTLNIDTILKVTTKNLLTSLRGRQ